MGSGTRWVGASLLLAFLVTPAAAGSIPEALAYIDAHRDQLPGIAYGMEAVAQSGADIRPDWWPTHDGTCPAAGPPFNARLRLLHALGTSGYGPEHLPGSVTCIRDRFDGSQTGDPATINDDAWSILALRAAGIPSGDAQIQTAVDVLAAAQRPDGGWSYQGNLLLGASDTDMTGMALVAVAAAGALDRIQGGAAAAYLDSTRHGSGGHRADPGAAGANAQSTVWALHGYHAQGRSTPTSSLSYLAGLQRSDGGFPPAAGYQSNAWVSAEVVPILAGALHPWPPWAPATITAPNSTWRHVPVPVGIEGPFTDAHWALPSGATMSGSGLTQELTFPSLGSQAVHVAARGASVHRAVITIDVENRLPSVVAPPATADRAHMVLHAWNAIDPDGDDVTIEWAAGGESGTGQLAFRPTVLGATTIDVTADDGYAQVTQRHTVHVRNLLPTYQDVNIPAQVVAGEPFDVALEAVDPDTDEPVTVQWLAAGEVIGGAAASLTLPAGEHAVAIRLADVDGGLVVLEAAIQAVQAPTAPAPGDASETPPPARVRTVEVHDPQVTPPPATGEGHREAPEASATAMDGRAPDGPSVQQETPAPGVWLAVALVAAAVVARRRVRR